MHRNEGKRLIKYLINWRMMDNRNNIFNRRSLLFATHLYSLKAFLYFDLPQNICLVWLFEICTINKLKKRIESRRFKCVSIGVQDIRYLWRKRTRTGRHVPVAEKLSCKHPICPFFAHVAPTSSIISQYVEKIRVWDLNLWLTHEIGQQLSKKTGHQRSMNICFRSYRPR